jgi:hypothetical protein
VKAADSFYCPTETKFYELNHMILLTRACVGKWVHTSATDYSALFDDFEMTAPPIHLAGVYLLAIYV